MGFFREGGIGMTIILVYMLCMLVVGWGFAIWQIVSLVLWRKKTAKLEDIASKRDAAELAEHLTGGKGKAPGDAAGAALVLACDRVRDDKAPRDILAEVRELLATRMAGVHPAKGVLSALVLLGAVVVPVTLGVLFQVVGLLQAFSAVGSAAPEGRCEMMAMALGIAAYPRWFGLVSVVLLVVPALVAFFLEVTFLGVKRRRDDILRLVEMLLGVSLRPATGIVPGIMAFVVSTVATLLLAWLASGPPVKNLTAPFLLGSCLSMVEGSDVVLPVWEGEGGEVRDADTVVVSGSRIMVNWRTVVEMEDGLVPAEEAPDGARIFPLTEALEEQRQTVKALCSRDPGSEGCGAPVVIALDEDVPLPTAAAVIYTAWNAWDGKVSVVVSDGGTATTAMGYKDMLREVRGFTGMRCVTSCPYHALTVKDVVGRTEGGAKKKGVLDGGAKGSFGEFVDKLPGPGFVVAVPTG